MSNTTILEIPSLHPHKKGMRIIFEKQEIALSQEALKEFHDLYDKIQESPKKHLEALKEFYHKNAHVPEVANLLAFAYLRTFKKKEAEALIERTWREHPDYLIGKINYAELALKKGQKELIPVIFGGHFELDALYPERESFHYTEFRGFMTLMGFYHLKIGDKEKAEEFSQLAFQVDPLHPSVASLEKELSKTSLAKKCLKALQKLAHISKKP